MRRTSLAQLSWKETFDHLQRVVSNHYDLGELVRAEVKERGYINVSFGIQTHREWKKANTS